MEAVTHEIGSWWSCSPHRCDKTWGWKRSPGGTGRARRLQTSTSWSAASRPPDMGLLQLGNQTRVRHVLLAHALRAGHFATLGKSLPHTVAYFLHYERVKADLVNALLQAVGLVDLFQFLVEHHRLWVRQLRAQYPIVEFLWEESDTLVTLCQNL